MSRRAALAPATEPMLDGVTRKARQLAGDPVLRRWLAGRLAGRRPGAPAFIPHRPPYLEDVPLPGAEAPAPAVPFQALPADRPAEAATLPLPGLALAVRPGQAGQPFRRSHGDLETELAVHRFAWLPLLGSAAEPAWVQALWQAWRAAHGTPHEGWAWHPYTAAERALNLLSFGRRRGLPHPLDDTLRVLAAHGPAIARRLEYFGEAGTSNHLSNNGRGLYVLGLELGLDACAEAGARILLEEARRIFAPSGILREGSSHYHLLLARNYADAWLAARRHRRPEEEALKETTARALGVAGALVLPGGMPLIGDVSPDCPPPFLAGLLPGGDETIGWTGLLEAGERQALVALRDGAPAPDREALRADGWLKADFAPWSGLWHAAPGGWSAMPGHGHQDCGSFELHFEGEPVFRDLGRATYGETGAAAVARSALAHNSLLVDETDPYPPNKPYYDDAFRSRVGGPPPELRAEADGVRLSHAGYGRLRGVGRLSRAWRFAGPTLTIADRVEGSGAHRLTRLLHTTLPAMRDGAAVVLKGAEATYRVRAASGAIEIRPAVFSPAYGEEAPATSLRIDETAALPWESTLTVEAAR